MSKQTLNRNSGAFTLTVHERVKNMRAHYAQTGAYRTEDLTHVLGDPRQGIVLAVPTNCSFSARKEK